MPVYAFRGLQQGGKEVKGHRDADSPKALRALLRREGIRIIDHHEETSRRGPGADLARAGKGLFDLSAYAEKKVSVAELALTTRQLATLLRSGITLLESLGAIVDQAENPKLKRVFGEIKSDVNEGASMADAMTKHPKEFGELYVSMVRAGEASGALDGVLTRLADFTEAQSRLRSKVFGALLYPGIMLGVGSIIMAVMFVVVIPRITKIFSQLDVDLPIQTKILIFMANVSTSGWFWLLFVPTVAGGVWYFREWKRSEAGRPKWDRFTLAAPVFGPLVRLVSIARFSQTLATLLRAGVPILKALDITKDVLNNHRLAEVIQEAREAIREGDAIANPLRKSGEFPPIVTQMVAVGEKSGQLEDMLENIAQNYEFQVNQRVERLTTLIEPVMILGMGVSVSFVVFSILMPIMELSQHVQK